MHVCVFVYADESGINTNYCNDKNVRICIYMHVFFSYVLRHIFEYFNHMQHNRVPQSIFSYHIYACVYSHVNGRQQAQILLRSHLTLSLRVHVHLDLHVHYLRHFQ